MNYLRIEQLILLGFQRSDINRKLSSGEWKWRTVQSSSRRSREREILLASLPLDVQTKWIQQRVSQPTNNLTGPSQPEQIGASLDDCLVRALTRLPVEERDSWIAEAYRLARIVDRYCRIKPKRRRRQGTSKYDFVPDVLRLCEEAACSDHTILGREPYRGHPPSPYTLDGWVKSYRAEGLLTFIPKAPTVPAANIDNRRAIISLEAAEWVNARWKSYFRKPSALYKEWKQEAEKKGWQIPSKSWLYRQWLGMPKLVKTFYLEGEAAYISKYAPFVPRDYSDLAALQVLCGDHSERDVMFLLEDDTLVRPWLSLWVDLRTWLIWGWYLSLIPSSHTAGLAYADGVINFGAQPPSRPEDGYFSFVYTDRDRTYRSHQWDGTVIAVHEKTMNIDGGLELLLTQRRVGILDEFSIKHLLAKRRNAKEKPVERVHKDISDWEGTFPEFCGRDAKNRPDLFRRMYAEHMQYLRGNRTTSPFRKMDFYREELANFIVRHNSSIHERSTLGGQRIVPLDEYRRLYTTHYKVSQTALALLIMKSDKRVIGKNGIQYFQKNWFYYHEALAEFKGVSVEIRYSDDDYTRIWVILPNGEVCEASLITPTSLTNPNMQTLKAVAKASKHERELINNYHLLQHSMLRYETTEDRVSSGLEPRLDSFIESSAQDTKLSTAVVHKLTRMDRKRTNLSVVSRGVSAADVLDARADDSIFNSTDQEHVSEFYGDEGE